MSRTPDTRQGPRPSWMGTLDVDDRDRDPDQFAPIVRHGHAQQCIALHIPGVTDREDVTRMLHSAIEAMPVAEGERDAPLCGHHHVEDIALHQMPFSARPHFRVAINQAWKRYRRPTLLVQAWQHIGPCENTP